MNINTHTKGADMKRTVNWPDFVDEWNRCKDRTDQFSWKGKQALWDYLEGYEEDTGEELELDIVALCCEFAEYNSLADFQKDYGNEYDTLEKVEERTTVIHIDVGYTCVVDNGVLVRPHPFLIQVF